MNKNIKKLVEYPKKGVLSQEILKNEKLDASLFCIAKHAEIGEHTSTKRGIVYVLEGKGIFKLGGKDIKMLPGVFIFMKENATHSLKAYENTSFMLILSK